MACPHASGCPLFPYLNASLQAWRVSYCDHDNGWGDCARYVLSGQGKPVPLALLPNGRMPVAMLPQDDQASLEVAHHLRPDAAARMSAAAAPDGAAVATTGAAPWTTGAAGDVDREPARSARRASGALRSSLRRGRGARSGGPADAAGAPADPRTTAPTAVAAPADTVEGSPVAGPGAAHSRIVRPRPVPVVDLREDWTRQDWVPAARPPWWRRLADWLGGTE